MHISKANREKIKQEIRFYRIKHPTASIRAIASELHRDWKYVQKIVTEIDIETASCLSSQTIVKELAKIENEVNSVCDILWQDISGGKLESSQKRKYVKDLISYRLQLFDRKLQAGLFRAGEGGSDGIKSAGDILKVLRSANETEII